MQTLLMLQQLVIAITCRWCRCQKLFLQNQSVMNYAQMQGGGWGGWGVALWRVLYWKGKSNSQIRHLLIIIWFVPFTTYCDAQIKICRATCGISHWIFSDFNLWTLRKWWKFHSISFLMMSKCQPDRKKSVFWHLRGDLTWGKQWQSCWQYRVDSGIWRRVAYWTEGDSFATTIAFTFIHVGEIQKYYFYL